MLCWPLISRGLRTGDGAVQMAAEEFGINPARISVRHGDVESTASDFGTPPSRRMAMAGGTSRAPAVCKRWDGGSHWGLFNVAQKAAEARTAAIKTLTDFLDQDPTGTRKMVYRMQVLQELTRTANANGHNTFFLTDIGGPECGKSSVAERPLTLICVSLRAARRRGAGGR